MINSGSEKARLHPIISDRPSVNFFEGALLGNGALGAVVCVRPDAIMIHFGHNQVWDIRLAEDNRDKLGTFQEVFEKVKAIPKSHELLSEDDWYAKYCKMARKNYENPYPRPFPCGTVVLGFDRRKVEPLGYELDISEGHCRVDLLQDGNPLAVDIFMDMKKDRLWMTCQDGSKKPSPSPFNRIKLIPDPETPSDLPKYQHQVDHEKKSLSFQQTLPFLEPINGSPATGHEKDRAFRLSLRVSDSIEKGQHLMVNGLWGDMGELERSTKGSDSFVAVVELNEGLASQFDIDSPLDPPQPSQGNLEACREESSHSWQDYWSMSSVSLSDHVLEEAWYRNLYFLNCAVREGTTCPGIFANWSYGKIGTPWHGDYHMNYNTQQPFWVTFSSNHLEKHLPYVSMIEHLLPSSQNWAEEYYNMRGAFFPHSAYPVEMTMNPYPVPTWGWEVFETPWAVQSLWWHYTYTQDKNFLKERAFEPLRNAVLFMIDYMTRPDAHGEQWGDDNYHIFPTVSPELYGLRPGFRCNKDGLTDLTLTKFIFKAFIEACRILEKNSEEQETLQSTQNILDHYPEYPKAETEMGTTFVSIRDEEPGVVYNCPANTMTVFPGEEHGLHSSPKDYQLALNSLCHQRNEGGNELVFLNLQASRLGALDLERFKRQIKYCELPNGTCTDKVLQSLGRYNDTTKFDWMGVHGIWFENFALPVVINECLMQSYNGIIRLFPNWPDEKDAIFQTLRAVGAFLVSGEKKSGVITDINIFSETGGTCRLYSPWPSSEVMIVHQEGSIPFNTEKDVITFDTIQGGTYQISHKTNPNLSQVR